MLLWYIETDLFCIEGVVVKRFFTLVCLVLCAFTLAVISFAHPGGTDGSGGHYNHDTGEYHYHHGYPEHQHPDGVCPYNLQENDITGKETNYTFAFAYVEADNLEDVILNEFEGEYGEEIRDVLIFNSDEEVLKIDYAYYIEYESLKNTANKEYGEYIAERIIDNPNLIILSPEEIKAKHGIEETEEETKSVIVLEPEKEKSFFGGVITKEAGEAIGLLFSIYVLICVIGYFKEKKKTKKRSRN